MSNNNDENTDQKNLTRRHRNYADITMFTINDKIIFCYLSDLVYNRKCPSKTYLITLIVEQQNGQLVIISMTMSVIWKHSCENDHSYAWGKDFKILWNNYNPIFKYMISEVLLQKQLKPSLNLKINKWNWTFKIKFSWITRSIWYFKF